MQEMQVQELDTLICMARAARDVGATDMEHMDGATGAFNSVRIANFVSSYLPRNIEKPVLDWGCGYGQITWLLQQRGIQVVSCDAEKRRAIDSIPQLASLSINYLNDPVRLPYDSESFSAVLSAGVLEHVPDAEGSLQEIHRVLRAGGLFFLFMFPNQFSWVEQIADLRKISVHPYKFTFRRTEALLQGHGFRIEKKWRRNLLPKNLTGLSLRIKSFYGRHYQQVESLDRVLCRLPPISWFSGVLEVVAKKE